MVEPVRHRRTKGAATDMFEPKATASHLDSTRNGHADCIARCPLSGAKRKTFARSEFFRFCEGFRMPAHDDGATHSGAGVRKPPREETAGGGEAARQKLWGFRRWRSVAEVR